MPLEDFDSPAEWRQDLDRRWPERLAIQDRLVAEVSAAVDQCGDSISVLELGTGDGSLALRLRSNRPAINLTAVDRNAVLCDYGRGRDEAIQWLCRDLTEPWRDELSGPFQIVYSLQTLHDLGGRDVLAQTYARVADALGAGGVFVHADFVEPMPHDDPAKPRRFAPDVHVELFSDVGLAATLVERRDLLGCFVATKT